MSKITPFFELNGNRYEIKRTRWLIAEYRRLNEESPLTDEDRANAVKASNLVADVRKFAEKEKEWWERLCEEPTTANRETYFMFKEMSDTAVAKYNDFVASNNTLAKATKHSIDILEQIVIKALAEQHFGMNMTLAQQTWEQYVDTIENHNKVAEWLNAMAQCLFGKDEETEDNGDFLSLMRRKDEEAENNRKNGYRKKR